MVFILLKRVFDESSMVMFMIVVWLQNAIIAILGWMIWLIKSVWKNRFVNKSMRFDPQIIDREPLLIVITNCVCVEINLLIKQKPNIAMVHMIPKTVEIVALLRCRSLSFVGILMAAQSLRAMELPWAEKTGENSHGLKIIHTNVTIVIVGPLMGMQDWSINIIIQRICFWHIANYKAFEMIRRKKKQITKLFNDWKKKIERKKDF